MTGAVAIGRTAEFLGWEWDLAVEFGELIGLPSFGIPPLEKGERWPRSRDIIRREVWTIAGFLDSHGELNALNSSCDRFSRLVWPAYVTYRLRGHGVEEALELAHLGAARLVKKTS